MKKSKPPTLRLKQNYLLNFETALIISLAAFIGIFKLQLPQKNIEHSKWKITNQEILHLEGIIATKQTPLKPATPPEIRVPIHRPKDEIIEEQLRNLDVEFPLSDPIPLADITDKPVRAFKQKNIPIQEMPQLIGGMAKLQRNITYPSTAIEDGIEGRVIVEFIVDEKGKVHNPKIIKGVRKDINREALKAISKSRFLPARQKGKPIPIEQVIYILFKLDNNS